MPRRKYAMKDDPFWLPLLIAGVGLLIVALIACNGGGPTLCDVEARLCTSNGGKWTPGPNCGTCTYPDPCDTLQCEYGCEDGKCLPPPVDPCDACTPEQTCVDGVCIDPPPPPPNKCEDIADPHASGWYRDDRPAQMKQKVKAAIVKVAGECGGNCGPDWIETLRRVARELNRVGHCATGPWVDALAVLAPDGRVEEFHPVYSGNGSWTDSGNGKYIGAWSMRGSTVSCGPPSPVALPRKINGPKRHGGPDDSPKFDATGLVIAGREYCEEIGFTDGRSVCPVRPECSGPDCKFKDREACEALVFGVPVWTSDGRLIKVDNPWMIKVRNGTWVQVCAGGVCGRKKEYNYVD